MSSTGILGVPTSPIVLDGQPLIPLTPLQQLNVPALPPAVAPPNAAPADWYTSQGIEPPLAPARPNPPGFQSALGPTGSGNPSILQQAKDALGIGTTVSLIFSARLIMLVVGIILIAAGAFSFKTTQQVAARAARAAAGA